MKRIALALGLALAGSAPAFAQDATQDPTTPAVPANPATPAQPEAPMTPAMPATPATPATPASAKQVSWSQLDADHDGKLSKSEAGSVKSLSKDFDQADANQDGALTTDEYKAYLATRGSDHAHKGG